MKEVAGFGKGKFDLRWVFSAAAGAFGFSSALPINQRSDQLDDFSGLKFREEFRGDGGEKCDRSVGDSSKDEDAVEVSFEGLCDGLEGVGIGMAEISDDGWRAVNRFDFCEQIFCLGGGFSLFGGAEGSFEFLFVSEQGVEFFLEIGERRAEFSREGLEAIGISCCGVVGGEARDGFDAPNASGDGGFTDDAEDADLPSCASMGARAEFFTESTDID